MFIWWASKLNQRVETLEKQVGNDIAGRRAFMSVRDDVMTLKQTTTDLRQDMGQVVLNLAELRKDMFGLMISGADPAARDERGGQGMTIYRLAHYTDPLPIEWRWPDFSPQELRCKGSGQLIIDTDALDCLQALRDALGKPIMVVSAGRSEKHNRAVGGAKASQHLTGSAFDCSMANHDPIIFESAARRAGFTGFGFYPKQHFIHIDIGPAPGMGPALGRRAVRRAGT